MIFLLWLFVPAALAGEAAPLDGVQWSVPATGPVASAPWWAVVDPGLQRAVEGALDRNGDVGAASAAVASARAVAVTGFAPLLPTVSADASVNRQNLSGGLFALLGQSSAPPTGTTATTATGAPSSGEASVGVMTTAVGQLSASWLIDLFGRQTATWTALRHQAEASEGDHASAAANLALAVAVAWLDVGAAEERLVLARQQATNAQSLLDILEERYARGDADTLDVLQQRQATSAARAVLPALELGRDVARHQLAVLTGLAPSQLTEAPAALPALPAPPGLGSPSELVWDRADLRAADARADAAQAQSTAAGLALLPTVSASGNVGRTGTFVKDVDTDEPWANTWSYGAVASLPLIGGGQRLGNVAAARANASGADLRFEQQALAAVAQVEDALAADRAQGALVTESEAQRDAAAQAWEAARARYLEGSIPFVTALGAWQAATAAELATVQARRDQLAARLQLHHVRGGPWTRDLD